MDDLEQGSNDEEDLYDVRNGAFGPVEKTTDQKPSLMNYG